MSLRMILDNLDSRGLTTAHGLKDYLNSVADSAEVTARFDPYRKFESPTMRLLPHDALNLRNAALIISALSYLLEDAYNGLRWWMEAFPHCVSEADYEKLREIEDLLGEELGV